MSGKVGNKNKPYFPSSQLNSTINHSGAESNRLVAAIEKHRKNNIDASSNKNTSTSDLNRKYGNIREIPPFIPKKNPTLANENNNNNNIDKKKIHKLSNQEIIEENKELEKWFKEKGKTEVILKNSTSENIGKSALKNIESDKNKGILDKISNLFKKKDNAPPITQSSNKKEVHFNEEVRVNDGTTTGINFQPRKTTKTFKTEFNLTSKKFRENFNALNQQITELFDKSITKNQKLSQIEITKINNILKETEELKTNLLSEFETLEKELNLLNDQDKKKFTVVKKTLIKNIDKLKKIENKILKTDKNKLERLNSLVNDSITENNLPIDAKVGKLAGVLVELSSYIDNTSEDDLLKDSKNMYIILNQIFHFYNKDEKLENIDIKKFQEILLLVLAKYQSKTGSTNKNITKNNRERNYIKILLKKLMETLKLTDKDVVNLYKKNNI